MKNEKMLAITLRLLSLALFLLTGCAAQVASSTPPAPQAPATLTPTAYLPLITHGPDVPLLGGCPVFPADNAWNVDISGYPLHPNSAAYIAAIGASGHLHPDFGSGTWEGFPIGIPYVIVPAGQALVPITFVEYGSESDPGPYPVPLDAPIEGDPQGDGDRHVLVVRQGECRLYELYQAVQVGGGWEAGSGAIFDLSSNALRPDCWTSADAAGLPILPGLARYDEVAAGEIRHALRFTVSQTQRGYIYPATHWASSSTDPARPPMGLRLRLRASYDLSGYTGQARVILEALKRYGMIVADNGSNWYISGAPDERWNNDDLHQLSNIPGSAFEVVYTGEIHTSCP